MQHLRFLVIEEADRLPAQSFQDWLAQVLATTRPPLSVSYLENASSLSSSLPYPDSLSPAFLHLLKDRGIGVAGCKIYHCTSRGAASNEGVLGVVMEQFSMPATLKKHMIVCDSSQKPLMQFHLMHVHVLRNALAFTKSAESTRCLVQLFEFFENARWPASSSSNVEDKVEAKPIVIWAYSSDLTPSEQKSILKKIQGTGDRHMHPIAEGALVIKTRWLSKRATMTIEVTTANEMAVAHGEAFLMPDDSVNTPILLSLNTSPCGGTPECTILTYAGGALSKLVPKALFESGSPPKDPVMERLRATVRIGPKEQDGGQRGAIAAADQRDIWKNERDLQRPGSLKCELPL
ncbi:hypothetical protein EW146_g3744 [Bondarzewia mesenterica]|uniref:Uncharacterized protein n=1 Tax=Bondarzewia mesenterica TaxID=1095465 RepID=A0A4S4LWN4_9AGAM|nr:hypothetical protein EW146_g3744 [Bondarzewia mesenterica]